jgi:uncharacterized membrane protein
MRHVTLIWKPGQSASETVRRQLQELQSEFPHRVLSVDLSREGGLEARFEGRYPVVRVGPYTLVWPFSLTDLRVTLGSTSGEESNPAFSPREDSQGGRRAKNAVHFVARHWLALANLALFLLVGLPFAAPVLMRAGAETPGRWIYRLYAPACHQLAFRSWFLFGDQPAYPRREAGLPGLSYGAASGLSEDDVAAARSFVGSARLGYKVAICQRDVAMYGSLALGGVIYACFRTKVKPLPVWAWLAGGILPIALDGGIQLVSRLAMWPFPVYESSPLFRTVTGTLFGLASVWLAYPEVEANMAATRALVGAQLSAGATPRT